MASTGGGHHYSRDFVDVSVWLLGKDTEIANTVGSQLKSGGFESFRYFQHCEPCFKAEGCKDCYQAFDSVPQPDLVVLEIESSNSAGLDVLHHLRTDQNCQGVPIVVTLGQKNSAMAMRDKAYQLGANLVLLNPYEPEALVAQAGRLVKAYRATRELEEFKQRMSQELRVAQRLQQSLQPSDEEVRECEAKTGLEVSFALHSSSELSGDFWGIKDVSDSKLSFFIADLTGHGVAAAANTYRLHEILSNERLGNEDLRQFVHRVSDRFYKRTPPDVFASLLVGVIDLERRVFEYVSAMAPSPLLWRRGAQTPILLYSAGLPIGVTPNPEHELHTVPFETGDRLFFYSDALIEAQSKEGGALGVLKPCDIMEKAIHQEARSVIGSIEELFCEETVGPLADDLTLLLISAPEEREKK